MAYSSREKQAAYMRLLKRRRRAAWIAANGPCTTCGSWEDLQVDHIDPGTKAREVNSMWTWSLARLEEELAKCQVLCKTCHRDKHRVGLRHGTRHGYGLHGCRCDACRAAHAAAERRRKDRLRGGPPEVRYPPKLTAEQVSEIRSRRAAGEQQTALAREFDVHPSLVSRICSGKVWKQAA